MTNVSTRAPDWQTYINKNVMEAGAATTAAVFDPDMKVLGVSEGFEVRRLAIPGSTTGMHHCSSAMHRRARGCGLARAGSGPRRESGRGRRRDRPSYLGR